MGIYIKGMNMPTEGEYNCTLYVCSDGSAYIDAWSFPEENDKFLVVSVPPHGRLIDADAISDAMYHEAFETDTKLQKWDSGCWIRYKMFEQKRDDAPTVIEAEE